MNKQDYRAESTVLEPTIHIGKSGIEPVVEELKKQLKLKKLIKVKFLRTAFIEGNKQELSERLAALTDSELIEVRGNTAVFRRKR
ncbi:putative RNA-binding protein containing KH domain, possibly ribosomal protein [Candidatus Methanoperedens nitroreducens]|uniref:Putative RNA-binding protein containing KH domain, possibly ribosomal protein n=1 Tax=Candidatus Methanoperedens nitratireducens TaxID=1392998 RepID=A0A062V025_9EURY|nr:YhbY family RNA-binding protein [Candidatus Methanoperedens nitroreducens]KCZ72486.1 putative RNA-binding protein containing KH domain, possibly ribosomal protein [Candidatus Methanoperedens nitroreducens]MDJ1423580.1 YhbY family RNA-binding protein [Candidatus Methanoperedens sp.]